MKKAYIKYWIVDGLYHLELIINGEWAGGGCTQTNTYDEAYIYAEKIAKTKNARVELFGRMR